MNIYTGEYGELDSTINRAAEIGRDRHKQFEEALPDGFHSVISRLVIPMKPKKRHRRAVSQERSSCRSIRVKEKEDGHYHK